MNYGLDALALYPGMPIWLLIIVIIWSLCWKGFSLWKAARKNSPIWFVVLLVVNTVGILEILYIFLFSKMNLDQTETIKVSSAKTRARKKRR